VIAEKIDNYSRQALLGMSSACAQCFSVFLTTTNPFRVPFQFSWQTWPLSTYAKAKNILCCQSATTISKAGLLSLCYTWAQCSSVFSTTTDPFLVLFRFSWPTQHQALNSCKGRKHSAEQIRYSYFHCRSPLLMLCMSTVILIYLNNCIFFVIYQSFECSH
jgi:hypothetical protein